MNKSKSISKFRRAAASLLFGLILSALALAAIGPDQAYAAVRRSNPSFETGDLSGWIASGPITVESSFQRMFTTSWEYYTAPYGSKFALLAARRIADGCNSTNRTTSLIQSFTGAAGDIIEGQVAFRTLEPVNSTTKTTTHNDYAQLKIVEGNVILFYKDVNALNGAKQIPWTPWTFTLPSSGTFTIEATATNVGDCYADSWLLLDSPTNAPPTVDAGGPYSSSEGSAIAINNASASDRDGDDLTYNWSVDSALCGFDDAGLLNPNLTCRDNGSFNLVLTVNDGVNEAVTSETSVTVSNVEPAASLVDDNPIDEGGSVVVSFTDISDPSSEDALAGFHYAFDCSGGSLAAATYASSGTSDSASCSFTDNGEYTVSGKIMDKDDGAAEYTTVVSINNVAPTAGLGNNSPVDEGGSAVISFSGASDPSSVDTAAGFRYAFDCNGGSLAATAYASSGTGDSTSCSFTDNGSFTVSGKVMDKDDNGTEYTTVVTVNNLAPTAGLGNNGPVDEGGSAVISFSGASDPSSEDTAAGFHYAFDCNGGSLAATTYASSGTSDSANCSFTDSGTYTVSGKVMDKDDTGTEYSTVVTVNNLAPTAGLGNNGPIDEGGSVVVSFSGASDPSGEDTAAGLHYAFDCSGGSLAATTYASSSTSDSASCSFTDNGSYTISGRIMDKDDGAAEFTTVVTVNNVAPAVSASGNSSSILQGETFSGSGSFSDPGSDSWSGSVNYGDGSPAESLPLSGNAFTLSHIYAAAGNYTITVTITDDDGGSGSASVIVPVNVAAQSPQEKVALLSNDIQNLIVSGVISSGNGNALTSKLDSAIQAFDKGNTNAGVNTLDSFINQVNALVKSGKLSSSEGQALISAAQSIIDGK